MKRPLLPILPTSAATYAQVFNHPMAFFRAGGLWMGLTFAVQAGLGFATLLNRAMPPYAETIISLFVGYIGAAMFAVAWHRIILLQETPGHVPDRWLTFAARYLGRSFALFGGLAVWVVAVAFMSTAWMSPDVGAMLVSAAVVLIAGVASSLVLGRLSLAFPGAAIGEPRMTFAMSWKFTVHNGWRLFAAGLLTVYPASLAGGLAGSVLRGATIIPAVRVPLIAAVDVLFLFVTTAMAAGLASNAYAFLTGLDRAKDHPPASEFS